MAAYQCLNCHQIEHGGEDCCDNPDLFCINNMPSEILRLRAALAKQPAASGEPVAWLRSDGMKAMTADEKDAWLEAGRDDLVADYTIPLVAG